MIDGLFWVWPDRRRTHVRFIESAIIAGRRLPAGFYAAAKRKGVPARFRRIADAARMRGIAEDRAPKR